MTASNVLFSSFKNTHFLLICILLQERMNCFNKYLIYHCNDLFFKAAKFPARYQSEAAQFFPECSLYFEVRFWSREKPVVQTELELKPVYLGHMILKDIFSENRSLSSSVSNSDRHLHCLSSWTFVFLWKWSPSTVLATE